MNISPLNIVHFRVNVNSKFLFDAGGDLRCQGDDVFGCRVIGIDDDERLFGPHLRAAECLAFPSALFDKPCRRDL